MGTIIFLISLGVSIVFLILYIRAKIRYSIASLVFDNYHITVEDGATIMAQDVNMGAYDGAKESWESQRPDLEYEKAKKYFQMCRSLFRISLMILFVCFIFFVAN